MLRSLPLASIGGLLCSAIVCAHAATAEATRPTLPASGALRGLGLAAPRDLDEILGKRLTGLNLEDAATRTRALKQARAYESFKKSGQNGLIAYLDACGKPSESEDPFCAIEFEIASEKATAARARARVAPRPDARTIARDINKGDLKRIASYTSSDLSRGVSQFSDFQELASLARKVVSTKDCAQGGLAAALASKGEEFFPDAEIVEITRQLYRRASDCGADAASQQARFRFALISIWQNKCKDADSYLDGLIRSPEGAVFHARAKYWRLHCATVTGNETIRTEMREALWRDHILTFHNLAANGMDPRLGTVLFDLTRPKVAVRSMIRPDLNTFIRGTEALLEIGATELSAEFMERLAARLTSVEPEVRLYAASLMNRAGYALPKFRILTSLFQDSPRLLNRATLQLLYPKWFHEYVLPKSKEIDPLLVLSLIRQESAFNVHARSSAGARGLMQVMPATARSIASVGRDRLFDVRTNIEVGTKYLIHRLSRYGGDVELTLAAYNAGFTRVDRWVKRYPLDNKVLFMDLIPFRETREYVSSILRNYFWYTQLYGTLQDGVTAQVGGHPEKISAILSGNAGALAPASIAPDNGGALAR